MNEKIDHTFISFPDQKNYEVAYGLALKLAGEKLSSISDLKEQCQKSDSICWFSGSSGTILLDYFNRSYQVALPEIQISIPGSNETVELRDKILILHYLTRAKGDPLSGKLISFHELKEGSVYFPSFHKRAIKPLMDYFGDFPQDLWRVSIKLGGTRMDYGDASVTIPAFKRVPITFVVWKGDTELPANANILFDDTIQSYLPTEDIIVLCQSTVWKLVKLLSQGL